MAYARLTDRPLEAMPPSEAEVPVVTERMIRIFGQMDGSARVLDANGMVIADLGPTEGGFVAGIYRCWNAKGGPLAAMLRSLSGWCVFQTDASGFGTT